MKFKTQTRFIFLFSFTVLLFVIVMVIINYFDKNRTDLLFHDFALNKEHLFDTIVDIKRAPLLTFVDDYSFWDEMVQFIYTRDKHWAKNNFDASLAAYKTDAIWVYDPHWALVYSTSRDNMRINKKLPLPQSAYRDLFRDGPFCHFFINTAAGIMEIYGATIHPTADRERKTPAKGYFFVGKVWSDIFLKELTQFTNSTVILTPYRLALNDFEKSIPKKGIIAFSRILIGADGVPISIVNVRSESQLIKSFYRSRTWEIWFLFGFLIIFILVLMISLTRWISKPLSLISSSMKLQNPAIINTLQDDTSEFGHIARLITEFFMQKNALQESQRTFLTLIGNLSGMVYRCRNDENWTMEFVSEGCYPLTGYQPSELLFNQKISYEQIIYSEDRDYVRQTVQLALNNKQQFKLIYRILDARGSPKWVLEQGRGIYNTQGELINLEGFITDITDRKKMEETLRELSLTDELTGLYNRRGFMTLAAQQLKIADRLKQELCLIYTDVDKMKWINDTLGHKEGDRALIETASVLRNTFRASDVIARIGGDEFVGLAIETLDKSHDMILNRLQENITAQNIHGTRSYQLSISVGIAQYKPDNPVTIEELLDQADREMYAQKRKKQYDT